MWKCRGVCQASGANVLLFILSFLLWNEILSLLACLRQVKGNIQMRRKGGRWQHMTWEDEWRTEHLIAQGQSVFLSRLSEIPHSTGQKQKGLSVSCLAETADWFQPSNPNIESSFKKERARQDSRLKLVREQEEELKEFKDNLCETICGGVWSAPIAHDRVSWWCFLCGCEASVPTAMNLSTVRSGVYAHWVSTATGRRAQCCHGDTNSSRSKHRRLFDIKVVFVEVKVTPSSPLLWLALPQAPCLIRGPLYHQRGPIVRDLHGLNSHGGIIENAPINKAGDTRMQSHQPAEIIQIGFTLAVTKAPYVTQCMRTYYIQKLHRTLHAMWSTHPLSFAHWYNSNLTVFLKN